MRASERENESVTEMSGVNMGRGEVMGGGGGGVRLIVL